MLLTYVSSRYIGVFKVLGSNYLLFLKAFLVAQVGLFAALVAVNNVFDYQSNFSFVQHVLTMDTTFEGNTLMWRAISSPFVHHLSYALIILSEAATGAICLYAAYKIFLAARIDAGKRELFSAKRVASTGLVLGITLWFSGFMTVGAEWFLMWQSDTWNGQSAAFRFIVIIFAVLIFLHLPEPDPMAEET